MPTYIYETIPSKAGATPRRFEVYQSMKDDALTKDPDTGEPVKRVITGGLEIPRGKADPGEPPYCLYSCGSAQTRTMHTVVIGDSTNFIAS